jgi:hypothetical protein
MVAKQKSVLVCTCVGETSTYPSRAAGDCNCVLSARFKVRRTSLCDQTSLRHQHLSKKPRNHCLSLTQRVRIDHDTTKVWVCTHQTPVRIGMTPRWLCPWSSDIWVGNFLRLGRIWHWRSLVPGVVILYIEMPASGLPRRSNASQPNRTPIISSVNQLAQPASSLSGIEVPPVGGINA